MVNSVETNEITSNILFDRSLLEEKEGRSNRTGKSPNKDALKAILRWHVNSRSLSISVAENLFTASESDFD